MIEFENRGRIKGRIEGYQRIIAAIALGCQRCFNDGTLACTYVSAGENKPGCLIGLLLSDADAEVFQKYNANIRGLRDFIDRGKAGNVGHTIEEAKDARKIKKVFKDFERMGLSLDALSYLQRMHDGQSFFEYFAAKIPPGSDASTLPYEKLIHKRIWILGVLEGIFSIDRDPMAEDYHFDFGQHTIKVDRSRGEVRIVKTY